MQTFAINRLIFRKKIHPWEVAWFRGEILEFVRANSLQDREFHPEDEDGHIKRYPLIQYRILDGKAGIIGIAAGSDLVEIFKKAYKGRLINFKGEEYEAPLSESKWCGRVESPVGINNHLHRYAISNWVPFNDTNWLKYQKASDDIVEGSLLVKQVITGNLLAFLKAFGIKPGKEEIIVKIHGFRDSGGTVNIHKTNLPKFSIEFSSNVVLPADIGLGRLSAFACGAVKVVG